MVLRLSRRGGRSFNVVMDTLPVTTRSLVQILVTPPLHDIYKKLIIVPK